MDINIDRELVIMREAYQLLENVDNSTRERIINWLRAKLLGNEVVEKSVEVAVTADLDKQEVKSQLPGLSQQDAVLLIVATLLKFSPRLTTSTREIGSRLDEIGYKVGHLTRALTLLAQQKPALVLLEKMGQSKQAQRKIKLTTAGIRKALRLGKLAS